MFSIGAQYQLVMTAAAVFISLVPSLPDTLQATTALVVALRKKTEPSWLMPKVGEARPALPAADCWRGCLSLPLAPCQPSGPHPIQISD